MLVLIGATSVAEGASADEAQLPLELTWDVPEGCPDSGAVVRRVEQILLGPAHATTLVIANAKVRSVATGRFELTLTMRTGDVEQTRTLDAPSCAALAEASAVVIALAIDPSHDTSETPAPAEPPREAPTTPSLPAAVTPPTPPVMVPIARPPSRLAVGIGLAAVIESGTLPSLAGGLDLAAALRAQGWRLGIHGTLWLPQHPIFDEASGAGASFDMVQLGAFGGYLWPAGAFAFGPCAEVAVSFVRVEGFDIRDSHSSWTSWPSVIAGARAEARITGHFGLFARADLLFPLDRPTFTLVTAGAAVQLHEPALPAPRFSLGTEVVIP
jgi:hypothetical protein